MLTAYVPNFISPSQSHGQCYYDPCLIKEEPKAQELKQVAQGHTKTTCKSSSPEASGSKAQAARYPLLPPTLVCAGLGWQKTGLSRLGVFPVLSMKKTSKTSPWLWALLLCCVHEVAIFISPFTTFRSAYCAPSAHLL